MKKDNTGFPLKLKVVVGFGLALFAIGMVGFLTFKSINNLSGTVKEISSPDYKSIQLKEILNDLSDAESAVRAYSITKSDDYLNPFYDLLYTIDNKLNFLRDLASEDERQLQKLDSLDFLIAKKLDILNEYLEMENDEDVKEALIGIVKMMDKDQQVKQTKKMSPKELEYSIEEEYADNNESEPEQIEVLEPIPEQEREKKNIFQRFWSKLQKNEEVPPASKTTRVPVPTITEEPKTKVRDIQQNHAPPEVAGTPQRLNVKKEIENVIKEMKVDREDVEFQMKEELVKRDKQIMDEIRSVIGRLEAAEFNASQEKASLAIGTASETINVITILSIVSVIIAIIFIGLLINDITRTNRYKAALQTAKQAAEQNAKAKEEFLANMSHEIRTPLTAIIGFTDQLRHSGLSQDQDLYVDHVKKSSDHLLTIVNDILDFSKIDSGNLKLENIPFNPAAIIKDIHDSLKPLADKKELKLALSLAPEVNTTIKGDPVRFRQILINLVNNAIKFTEAGGIEIKSEAIGSKGNILNLSTTVKDTGIGIPDNKVNHIFQMFNQADSSTTRRFGGTGLGLSISKKLVEMQRGTISVKSVEGDGSEFTFVIPYRRAKEKISKPEKEILQDYKLLKGKRILIADDDKYVQALLESMIKEIGASPIVTGTAQEAIDKLTAEDFDAIFMDIQMPGMNGIEAAKIIRTDKNKSKANTPLIALTANILQDKKIMIDQAGFDDFITKPFKKETIYQSLLEHIKGLQVSKTKPKTAVKKDASVVTKTTEDRYDLTVLKEESHGNNDFVVRMVQLFIDHSAENIQLIKEKTRKQQWKEVGAIAHKMAPSFNHLGIDSIGNLYKEIEHKVAKEEIKDIPNLVNAAVIRSEKIISLLKAEMEILAA